MLGMPDLNMIDAALQYAKKGWPVFPCSRWDKAPLTQHGFKDATTDPEKIKRRFAAGAMIGVPTGKGIGAFVLDINPPAGRDMSWCIRELELAIGTIPRGMQTITPNGAHLWFRMPGTVEIRNRGPLLGGAIDCIRGEGGYVIVPPSVKHDGKQYSWLGFDFLAEPPAKLIELVKPQ